MRTNKETNKMYEKYIISDQKSVRGEEDRNITERGGNRLYCENQSNRKIEIIIERIGDRLLSDD